MNAVAFTPGVNGTTRLGSPQDQNNIMMNGISAMDTGNNGQMLNLNIESIGEVKVITQGYQAEYGRSSGLQITRRDQERHEFTPRVGLRYLHELGLEFKVVGESEERHPTGVFLQQHLRLQHWRAGGNPESLQRAQ